MPSVRFQAVLLADVLVRDAGVGHRMELAFKDGDSLRVRASPEVLRLRLQSRRRYRATLNLRTGFNRKIREPLYLVQVQPIVEPLQNVSGTSWSATGLVANYPRSVVVWSNHGHAQSVQISYTAGPGLLEGQTVGESVRVEGVLKDRLLIATSLEELPPLTPPLQERRRISWEQEFLDP